MFGFGAKKKEQLETSKPGRLARALTLLFGRYSGSEYGEDFFEDLADLLVESDMGASLAWQLIEELKKQRKAERLRSKEELLQALRLLLKQHLRAVSLHMSGPTPQVILCVGVNGVGKTTNLAKLAYYYRAQGVERIVFGAGDTFRAAAGEQLALHATRLGVRIVAQQHGSDPAAVLHDAVSSAKSRGEQLVLLDTAGRMHSQENLMKQLCKIDRVLNNLLPREQRCNLLVIDATTGQNALQQAEVFHQAIGVDAVLLAKLDSIAAGGLAVAIGHKLQLPFAFWGEGEGYQHLRVFEVDEYLDRLFAGL